MLPPLGHLIRLATLSAAAAAGLLGIAAPGAIQAADIARWISPAVRKIDAERHTLEQTLAALPPAPAPHLTERLGYHSGYSASRDTVEWVEMDLGKQETVDAVVLIAAPSDNGDSASAGYGFPVRFRVELSDKLDGGERVVIKKYANRRLYNTRSSAYVTLEHLAEMVKQGVDFVVFDAPERSLSSFPRTDGRPAMRELPRRACIGRISVTCSRWAR